MRKKLIAGNWKMHLTPNEARVLVATLRRDIDPDAARLAADREILIAPPAIDLPAVAQALAGSSVALGAQNMHFEDQGAFTGEISPLMLKSLGVRYVIIGHSERRHGFHEDDDLINRKVRAALKHGLTPILCVGETAGQRDAGDTLAVVLGQLEGGLAGIDTVELSRLILAYEPVWAIGTGRTATPDHARAVHGAIRGAITDRFTHEASQSLRILYGGSVTSENVDALMSKPDIDGALVGSASLKADSFARIIRAQITRPSTQD
jgi:triosephosphate isomerase